MVSPFGFESSKNFSVYYRFAYMTSIIDRLSSSFFSSSKSKCLSNWAFILASSAFARLLAYSSYSNPPALIPTEPRPAPKPPRPPPTGGKFPPPPTGGNAPPPPPIGGKSETGGSALVDADGAVNVAAGGKTASDLSSLGLDFFAALTGADFVWASNGSSSANLTPFVVSCFGSSSANLTPLETSCFGSSKSNLTPFAGDCLA